MCGDPPGHGAAGLQGTGLQGTGLQGTLLALGTGSWAGRALQGGAGAADAPVGTAGSAPCTQLCSWGLSRGRHTVTGTNSLGTTSAGRNPWGSSAELEARGAAADPCSAVEPVRMRFVLGDVADRG